MSLAPARLIVENLPRQIFGVDRKGLRQKGAYSAERRFSVCRTRCSQVRGLRPEIDGARSFLYWKCQARSGGLV